MIRVVLDTNILVSALLQPQGLPARTFLMTLAAWANTLTGRRSEKRSSTLPRHRTSRRGGEPRVGQPTRNYSIRERKRVTVSYPQLTSG